MCRIIIFTAWKVSKYGVISVPYLPAFRLNTGKYGPEITPYLDTFRAVLFNLSLNFTYKKIYHTSIYLVKQITAIPSLYFCFCNIAVPHLLLRSIKEYFEAILKDKNYRLIILMKMNFFASVFQVVWPQARSSLPELFYKKGVLRNFTKIIGKHLCRVSFLIIKVGGLKLPIQFWVT